MSNISIKINFTQFKSVVKNMKRKDGSEVECLVLPIESNNFFKGEKGVYADITGIQIKNKVGDSKDTHLLKQNFSKELYESMSEEERKSKPILGNAILWSRSEPDPVQADISNDEENDDLPF